MDERPFRTVSQVIQEYERSQMDDGVVPSFRIPERLAREILDHLRAHERLMQELNEGAQDPVAFDDMRPVQQFCKDTLETIR